MTRFSRPRWGTIGYELVDAAAAVLAAVLIGYVLTKPPASVNESLFAPVETVRLLGFARNVADGRMLWGWTLSVVAVVALVCAWVPRWWRFGYTLLFYATFFWATCLAVGVLAGASPRMLIYVLLFGMVASRLAREYDAELFSEIRAARSSYRRPRRGRP